MHRSVEIAIYEWAQPDDATWTRGTDLVRRLAELGLPASAPTMGGAIRYVLTSEDDDRLRPLLRELESARERWGLVWEEYRLIELDPDDFRRADLLIITGAGVDDGGSLLLNEDRVLHAPAPCPQCGSETPTDRPVAGELCVDGTRLTAPSWVIGPTGEDEGVVEPTRPWDLVTLPNLGVLASPRLVDVLRAAKATGWRISPVLDASGETSDALFLLEATTVDARPCVDHSRIDPAGVCQTCGIVLGERLAPVALHVRRSDLDDLDIVSTGQFRHGPLMLTRRVFDALTKADLRGVMPVEPRQVCNH